MKVKFKTADGMDSHIGFSQQLIDAKPDDMSLEKYLIDWAQESVGEGAADFEMVSDEYLPPAPPATPDDVDFECARRLYAMVGARDGPHFDRIQADGQNDAIELLNLKAGGEALSEAQQTRDREIAAFRTGKQALTNACKTIKSDLTAGSVFTVDEIKADPRWPTFQS